MSPVLRSLRRLGPIGAALLLLACPGKPPSTESSADSAGDAAGAPAARQAPSQATGWRHKRTSLTTKLGSARHSAVDAIVNPGARATVRGKFAYGKVSKDLEDEDVWLLVHQTAGQGAPRTLESARTDSDGRVALEIPGDILSRAGAYPYELLVAGDLSTARGTVWVVERGQKVVVFDIDGTLTTGDSELIDDAFGGDIDVREGAVDVVRHWHDAGHMVVFLTGRPYMYNASTRAWLEDRGFPPGPMATADTLSQAVPTSGGVGAFKRAWLRALVDTTGVHIAAAYGNAATDICAFAQAGIAPSATYIIANDQKSCTDFADVNSIADYPSHLRTLRAR